MKIQKKLQRGQTLLEVLLALSVVVLIIGAITVVVVNSLNNATFTKNQNLATQYAQEGIEYMRRKRDSSWSDFFAINDTTHWCLPKLPANLEVRSGSNNNVGDCEVEGDIKGEGYHFVRSIEIDHSDSSDCPDNKPTPTPPPVPPPQVHGSEVTATVLWSDGKCPVGDPYCHEVRLVTCFYRIDHKTI